MLKKIAEIFEKEVKKEIPEFDESQLATTSLMILTAKYDGEFDEVSSTKTAGSCRNHRRRRVWDLGAGGDRGRGHTR